MAHKLLLEEEPKRKKKDILPNIEGKFGIGIMIGGREVFLGVSIFPVIVEQVVKRRMIKPIKGKAKVFNFD